MVSLFSRSWKGIFDQWVRRRNPRTDTKRLTQRNVFILPTKEGFFFGGLLIILLLTAINYQNSLVYLVTFLLGALFVFSINICFSNMSGLSISLTGSQDCYEGENGFFSVALKSERKQAFESLDFFSPDQPVLRVDVPAYSITDIVLSKKAVNRGLLFLGGVKVETRFPLGLIRAWTFVDFESGLFVYPSPLQGIKAGGKSENDEKNGVAWQVRGQEELAGLRDYNTGDSMNRIAWKHYAAKGELYVKELEATSASSKYLSYEDYPFDTKEKRLRHLCYDVLESNDSGTLYGLILPGATIEPAKGENHKRECLRALAVA